LPAYLKNFWQGFNAPAGTGSSLLDTIPIIPTIILPRPSIQRGRNIGFMADISAIWPNLGIGIEGERIACQTR
jgi:hypothetical protein